MADKSWKAHERQIACLLGGQRLPYNGRSCLGYSAVGFTQDFKAVRG